jgi:hypothetical protein
MGTCQSMVSICRVSIAFCVFPDKADIQSPERMGNPLSAFLHRAKHNGLGRSITVPPQRTTINDGQPTKLYGRDEPKPPLTRG